jgi:hypothetical protein
MHVPSGGARGRWHSCHGSIGDMMMIMHCTSASMGWWLKGVARIQRSTLFQPSADAAPTAASNATETKSQLCFHLRWYEFFIKTQRQHVTINSSAHIRRAGRQGLGFRC